MLRTRTEKMLLNTTLTEVMEDSIKLYYGSFKIKTVQSQCSMNNNYCIDSKTYQEYRVFTPISAAFNARKLISGANSSEYGNFSFVTAECGLVCHVKCSPNVPHTCGLPSQLVEHFTETLQEQKNDENSLIPNSQSTTKLGGRREGWLRVPRYGSSCLVSSSECLAL